MKQYQMSNPFLAPDFSSSSAPRLARPTGSRTGSSSSRCSARSRSASAVPPAWTCPRPARSATPGGIELMRHQARFIESARAGHRSYLLADEPGLGKTAQALLAANVTGSYPLLVVVPERRQGQLGPRGREVDAAARRRPSCTATATTSTPSPTS